MWDWRRGESYYYSKLLILRRNRECENTVAPKAAPSLSSLVQWKQKITVDHRRFSPLLFSFRQFFTMIAEGVYCSLQYRITFTRPQKRDVIGISLPDRKACRQNLTSLFLRGGLGP